MEDWPPRTPAEPEPAGQGGELRGQDPDVDGYLCPACGSRFIPDAEPVNGVLQCPACGEQFFAPADSGEYDEGDDDGGEDDETRLRRAKARAAGAADTEELDGLRIRQLAALRRGAYRARSYCIIVAAALLVGAGKLVLMTIDYVRELGVRPRPIGYAIFAVLALMAASYLSRRAYEMTLELRQSRLSEPEAEPDFSTLSDGSQHAQNLERMSGRDDAPGR